MIGSLDEAWAWYRGVLELNRTIRHLGKYWDDLPWESDLGRDNVLSGLSSKEILDDSRVVLGDLDDLCVLLLFSVFESIVRERVLSDIEAEIQTPRHPALKQFLRGLSETISHGSFYRVLEAYKGLDVALVEQVNQVRRYRNWVAHGRRGEQPEDVTPDAAFKRLQKFLVVLAAAPSSTS